MENDKNKKQPSNLPPPVTHYRDPYSSLYPSQEVDEVTLTPINPEPPTISPSTQPIGESDLVSAQQVSSDSKKSRPNRKLILGGIFGLTLVAIVIFVVQYWYPSIGALEQTTVENSRYLHPKSWLKGDAGDYSGQRALFSKDPRSKLLVTIGSEPIEDADFEDSNSITNMRAAIKSTLESEAERKAYILEFAACSTISDISLLDDTVSTDRSVGLVRMKASCEILGQDSKVFLRIIIGQDNLLRTIMLYTTDSIAFRNSSKITEILNSLDQATTDNPIAYQ